MNARANVGSSQFSHVVGLTVFGIEKTIATGFPVVVLFVADGSAVGDRLVGA